VYRGLYIGGGLGFLGAPEASDSSGLAAALGGFVGLGYEFFLNQSAAMSIGLDYDLRVTTDKRLRQGPWLGIRFRFY
jgi:hypothetical protein